MLPLPGATTRALSLAFIALKRTLRHRSPSLPLCFRCQTINPLLNQNGDTCIACGHPFIRSFVSFEGTPRHRPATSQPPPREAPRLSARNRRGPALPVVRFVPERGISPEEALMLLRRDAPPKEPKRDKGPANPWASNDPDVNVLSLAGDVEHAQSGSHFDIDDPFTKARNSARFCAIRRTSAQLCAILRHSAQFGAVRRHSP